MIEMKPITVANNKPDISTPIASKKDEYANSDSGELLILREGGNWTLVDKNGDIQKDIKLDLDIFQRGSNGELEFKGDLLNRIEDRDLRELINNYSKEGGFKELKGPEWQKLMAANIQELDGFSPSRTLDANDINNMRKVENAWNDFEVTEPDYTDQVDHGHGHSDDKAPFLFPGVAISQVPGFSSEIEKYNAEVAVGDEGNNKFEDALVLNLYDNIDNVFTEYIKNVDDDKFLEMINSLPKTEDDARLSSFTDKDDRKYILGFEEYRIDLDKEYLATLTPEEKKLAIISVKKGMMGGLTDLFKRRSLVYNPELRDKYFELFGIDVDQLATEGSKIFTEVKSETETQFNPQQNKTKAL